MLFDSVRTGSLSALYRAVSLAALRRGSNQAASFSKSTYAENVARRMQPQYADVSMPSWHTTLVGLLCGIMGPLSNQSVHTVKTRIQTMSFPIGIEFLDTSWENSGGYATVRIPNYTDTSANYLRLNILN